MEKNKEIKINLQTAIFIAIIIILLVTVIIMALELNRKNLTEKTNANNIEESQEKENSTKYNDLTEMILNDIKNENNNSINEDNESNTNNVIQNSNLSEEDSIDNKGNINTQENNVIEYKNLTETIWNNIKAEKGSKANIKYQKYYFMTNNIIKNSNNTYTIQGAIYEYIGSKENSQTRIFELNEEKGYYQITVSEDVVCKSIGDTKEILFKEYYEEYYTDSQEEPYEQFIYSNGGEDFIFEDGICVEYKYDGR